MVQKYCSDVSSFFGHFIPKGTCFCLKPISNPGITAECAGKADPPLDKSELLVLPAQECIGLSNRFNRCA